VSKSELPDPFGQKSQINFMDGGSKTKREIGLGLGRHQGRGFIFYSLYWCFD